jgi:hypothetical protein
MKSVRVSSLTVGLLLALGVMAASLSGCAALAWVAPLYGDLKNLSDPACSRSFSTELVAALKSQGETPEDAADAAGRALRIFSSISSKDEPEHFEAASSSGVSYWFNFEPKKSGCLLRMYGRQKDGGTSWNTATYYDKRQLAGCTCTWNFVIDNSTESH